LDNFIYTIETNNLTKKFKEVTAVNSLTISVKKGEIFALVGPDGAGKSTTMRMLTAIMDPTGGDARVAGFDIKTEGEKIREHIAYMSQRFGLYEDLTVQENMTFYADLYEIPQRERPALMEKLLGFSQMKPFRQRLAGNLSGGMKQKLGLACALIHKPDVLFLDEPTNGVDPISRRDFWNILYELLQEKVTIFVTTAYLDEAERANRVGFIHKGNLLLCETPEEMEKSFPFMLMALKSSDNRRARDILNKDPLVIKCKFFGEYIHIMLEKNFKEWDKLWHNIEFFGLDIYEKRLIKPSLEDCFINLVEEEGGKTFPYSGLFNK
jgi:ABC-2 type transport system ATP-binding protein